MDEIEALQSTYARMQVLVDGLEPADLTRPSPCSEWNVHALLAHLVAATDGFAALLRGEKPDWAKDALGDDPATTLRQSVREALVQWRRPGAADAPSPMMPGMRMIDMALADAVAHTWDLATALGRDPMLDEDAVRLAYDRWAHGAADTGRQFGAFGPEISVPDDARLLDRFVGLLGRTPR
ncbi:MAG: TIGR03086 family metal-binding protein [Pseudonocardiaceae bacterium]